MITEKKECKRLGDKYLTVLNHINYFINGFSPAKDMLNNYVIEKLDELCIGLETGQFEIIEFDRKLSEKVSDEE